MDFNQHAYNLEFFNFTPELISAERKYLFIVVRKSLNFVVII